MNDVVPTEEDEIGLGSLRDGDEPFETGGDGVVKCMSARIPGVDSELVVHSGHSMQSHPDTILEVNRILRLHIDQLAAKGLMCGRADDEVFP